jgi:hypothetical protein
MRRASQDRRVYRYAWTTAWREQQYNVETTDTIPRKNCIAPAAVSTRRLFRKTTSVRNRTRVLDLRIHANTKKTLRMGTNKTLAATNPWQAIDTQEADEREADSNVIMLLTDRMPTLTLWLRRYQKHD